MALGAEEVLEFVLAGCTEVVIGLEVAELSEITIALVELAGIPDEETKPSLVLLVMLDVLEVGASPARLPVVEEETPPTCVCD